MRLEVRRNQIGQRQLCYAVAHTQDSELTRFRALAQAKDARRQRLVRPREQFVRKQLKLMPGVGLKIRPSMPSGPGAAALVRTRSQACVNAWLAMLPSMISPLFTSSDPYRAHALGRFVARACVGHHAQQRLRFRRIFNPVFTPADKTREHKLAE